MIIGQGSLLTMKTLTWLCFGIHLDPKSLSMVHLGILECFMNIQRLSKSFRGSHLTELELENPSGSMFMTSECK